MKEQAPSDEIYEFGAFRLIPSQRALLLNDEPVRLGTRAFDLLRVMVERAGSIVPPDELRSLVWPGFTVDEANLRVQLGAIRKALVRWNGGERAIETIPLRGYVFVLPVSRSQRPASEGAQRNSEPNLPSALTATIGREDDIALLSESLVTQRLITIVGPGGIGKTTLALDIARRARHRFGTEIYFCDFSSLFEAGLVPSKVASTLGIRINSFAQSDSLIEALRGRKLLLVLDTCEHLIDATASLTEALLSNAPEIHICATSREPLRVPGEWLHRLRSLSTPPSDRSLSLDQAMAYPAFALFVQRARAGVSRFDLAEKDVSVISDICRRLEGIPLAIEFAAARVEELGVHRIASQLDDLFGILIKGRRTALPRHQTLEAMLEWSYDLLAGDEQLMLRRLSCFRGAFTAEAAGIMAEGSVERRRAIDLLSSLFLKSLVSVDLTSEAPFYRLLDTTRAFATHKARSAGELPDLLHRHASYLLTALSEADSAWEDLEPAIWTERYCHLLDDLRAALDGAFAPGGDTRFGIRLTTVSAGLWFSLSLLDEYSRRIEQALEAADRIPVDASIHIRLWDVLGHTLWHSHGRIPDMIAAFDKALDHARREGLVDAELRALWGLLVGSNTSGDYARSIALLEDFGSLAAKGGDANAILTHRRMSALALHYAGDHRAARAHAEFVLSHTASAGRRSRQIGLQFDQRVTARSMLARVLWLEGLADQARDCAQEGTEIARRSGHVLSLCFVLANATIPIAFWTGDRSTASTLNQELLRRTEEHALVMWNGFARSYRSVLDRDLGSLRESVHPDVGAHLHETIATIDEEHASDVALDRGERGLAGWSTPELLRVRAKRLSFSSNPDDLERAESLLIRSIELANEQGALAWRLRSAITLAEMMLKMNRTSDGFEILESTQSRFKEGYWTADMVHCSTVLQSFR